ncbi:MAG: DUF1552 domain-containing protein [Lentisphaerales bacterium]|nr:DUF1552 domain-containing protein [Lentisphaerales bacterium]
MKLTRRTILKGSGGLTMSLPWLEINAENKKKIKRPPRLAFLFAPNGVNEHKWDPKVNNGSMELSPILKPLENLKSQVDVFKNLYHEGSIQPGGHFPKTANFLSGVHINRTTGKDIKAGTTIDQIVAQKYGQQAPLPSIELGIEPTRTGISVATGYTMVYGGHISCSNPTSPVPKEIYPGLAFDRLFNNQSVNKSLTSVLDQVKDDSKTLMKQLGAEDKIRLDSFFTSVRSLEKRITSSLNKPKEQQYRPPKHLRPEDGIPADIRDHIKIMLDLIVLSFQMNRTNIASFMYGNSVSGKNFSFIDGVHGGFHEISHHTKNKKKLDMYWKINRYIISTFAAMLHQMDEIKEGDRSLLDNSFVLFGSGLRDGIKHSPIDLPILLAGKGRQNITRGQHRVYKPKTPLCNLLLGILQASGIEQEKFNYAKEAII